MVRSQSEFMSSQEHRDAARALMKQFPFDHDAAPRAIARAQVHATLAVYEGMYELLGDDSVIDNAARESVMRGV